MAEETLRAFLNRRERELEHQIAGLRGALDEIETELVEVRKAKSALPGTLGDLARAANPMMGSLFGMGNALMVAPAHPTNALENPLVTRTTDLGTLPTIQQMVQRALKDNFTSGATSHALREYMRDVYRMTIQPDSLRSQLARMKAKGIIEKNELTDMWRLTIAGYGYDDPSKLSDDD